MTSPLRVTENHLRTHLNEVENLLTTSAGRNLRLIAAWERRPLVAGLGREGCEMIERNRGPESWVAPIALLKGSIWAWLGYREEWAEERATGGAKQLAFSFSSMTIHFGPRNYLYKPQIFRAEWVGLNWNGTEFCQPPLRAGHPHWQFDGLESLRAEAAETAAEMLGVLQLEQEEGPRDFSPHGVSKSDLRELVAWQEVSRLHFPSAACWWRAKPNDAHAHVPRNVQELRKWLRCTLSYVTDELTRLQ